MRKALGKNALKQYGVNRLDTTEELDWTLFDYTTYNAAGHTTLSFFQTPVGQGGKTKEDTNMDLAGQIPRMQEFLVERIIVDFTPGVALSTATLSKYSDDVQAVANSGILRLNVGSKYYKEEGPLGIYPPNHRLEGFASTGLTAGNYNYSVSGGIPHDIIPISLTASQNFTVTLEWAAAKALPSTTAGRIGVRLGGRLYRKAQ